MALTASLPANFQGCVPVCRRSGPSPLLTPPAILLFTSLHMGGSDRPHMFNSYGCVRTCVVRSRKLTCVMSRASLPPRRPRATGWHRHKKTTESVCWHSGAWKTPRLPAAWRWRRRAACSGADRGCVLLVFVPHSLTALPVVVESSY